MQQLHLVGLTTDHSGLILSSRRGAKTGKYTIAADEKLLAAVQEALRLLAGGEVADEAGGDGDGDGETATKPGSLSVALPPPPPAKPVSSLSPREIQGRLRAGGTVSEIAAAAGVDEEWILRFADPIRAEQARVVERAQRLTFNKSRLGPSAEPLETSVLLNLAERGIRLPDDIFAMAWTAFNLHGTSWAVVFSYTSRQRRQTAQWEVDLRSGELIARNRLASDLGYLEPGRRRRRLEPLEVPGEDEATAGTRRPASAAKGSASRQTAAKAAKPAAKVTAKSPPPKRSPAVDKAPASARNPAAKKASARAKATPATGKSAAPGNSVVKKAMAPASKTPVKKDKAPATKAPVKKDKAPASKAPVKKDKAPATRNAGRQSSVPRPKRPPKKPAAKKPVPRDAGSGAPTTAATSSTPALPERPTHLARPPSPMNPSNRAVTLPGRLVGAPSLRPPIPPAPRPRPQAPSRPAPARAPAFRPRPRPVTEDEGVTPPDLEAEEPTGGAAASDRAPGAGPPAEDDSRAASAASAEPAEDGGAGDQPEAESAELRVRKRRSERRITPRDEDNPSIVILSTPAVRRLEPPEEPRSRSQAPGS